MGHAQSKTIRNQRIDLSRRSTPLGDKGSQRAELLGHIQRLSVYPWTRNMVAAFTDAARSSSLPILAGQNAEYRPHTWARRSEFMCVADDRSIRKEALIERQLRD